MTVMHEQKPAHPLNGGAVAPIAVQLGEFVSGTRVEAMPARVLELARSRLLDAIGTAIEAHSLPVPAVAQRFVGASQGPATIIGSAQQVSTIDAAFVNASLVNGCTHDDFLAKSHAGAVVVPAALAVAEEVDASGVDLLAGIVLGYDVVARAYVGGPGMLPRFRASGVPGAVGAAAAAARMFGLSAGQTANALGLSTMFASGFGEGFLSGTMDVKLNVAWASRSGVSAAQLARCGATAAPTAFEGKSGYFNAFANSAERAGEAVRGLGERFFIEDTVYKERPVCIFVQTPVELAHRLTTTHRFDAAKIERVRIRAPLETLTNPGYQNTAPFATQLQARISVRFCVAAALLGRPVDTYEYFDQLNDAQVLALAARIDLLPPEDTRSVFVEVLHDGKSYSEEGFEMDHLLPTPEKVVAKFRHLTAHWPAGRSDALLDHVMNVEKLTSVRALTALLRGA
ncbi:MAG TPA: MmgE/PrpD family protein [Paraburkholderia sp.]|jgi:2-methylcitrate dehydratase PrpD